MIVLGVILAHLTGDYLLQSDWMALQKTRRWWPAVVHGITYTAPYALVTQSLVALAVIGVTHIVIDRFRLARYVVFAKNFLAPRGSWPVWENCRATGYPADRPEWLTVWLMIVADNTLHLLINAGAVSWL